MVDLSVNLAGMEMDNPVVPASGTFGFGNEFKDFYDINILGSFLIGFISTIALKKSMNPHLVLLLKTGLCGGFTTFSTFTLESFTLHKNGNTTLAMIYIVLSIVLGLSAVILGDYCAH